MSHSVRRTEFLRWCLSNTLPSVNSRWSYSLHGNKRWTKSFLQKAVKKATKQTKSHKACWAACRTMHPGEEAELLIWQLDPGTVPCRVFCRIDIWLLHTLIHPQLWEHSCSYTMHFLLLISCTYGYKTWALLRDYLNLPLHVACYIGNIVFQTVYTHISKITEKTQVKWQ